MIYKILLPVFLGLLFPACDSPVPESADQTVTQDSVVETDHESGQVIRITEEEDNQLLTGNPFPEIGETMNSFLEAGFRVNSRSPYENRHVPGQVDTIVVLTKDRSRVELYHAPEKYMVMSAEIHDPAIKLPGDIHTGIEGDEFLRRIDRPSLAGQNLKEIRLENPVMETSITFYFKDGKMRSFLYRGYVD